jgi:hypothetical protein
MIGEICSSDQECADRHGETVLRSVATPTVEGTFAFRAVCWADVVAGEQQSYGYCVLGCF